MIETYVPDGPTLGPVAPPWPVRAGDLVEVRGWGGILAVGAVNYVDKDGVALVDYVGKSRITDARSSLGLPPENRVRVHVRYLRILEAPEEVN